MFIIFSVEQVFFSLFVQFSFVESFFCLVGRSRSRAAERVGRDKGQMPRSWGTVRVPGWGFDLPTKDKMNFIHWVLYRNMYKLSMLCRSVCNNASFFQTNSFIRFGFVQLYNCYCLWAINQIIE